MDEIRRIEETVEYIDDRFILEAAGAESFFVNKQRKVIAAGCFLIVLFLTFFCFRMLYAENELDNPTEIQETREVNEFNHGG